MNRSTLISIPSLVRIKPGALSRLGIYLERAKYARIVVLASEGLPEAVRSVVRAIARKWVACHNWGMAIRFA